MIIVMIPSDNRSDLNGTERERGSNRMGAERKLQNNVNNVNNVYNMNTEYTKLREKRPEETITECTHKARGEAR